MPQYTDPELFKKPRFPFVGQVYYNLKDRKLYRFIDGFWRDSNYSLKKERIDKLKKLNELNS